MVRDEDVISELFGEDGEQELVDDVAGSEVFDVEVFFAEEEFLVGVTLGCASLKVRKHAAQLVINVLDFVLIIIGITVYFTLVAEEVGSTLVAIFF